MKLWGVSMVRNEEDIVEAFVRHNLTVLDGLLVVDHQSSDRTLDVLRALCAERLPLVVTRNESPGHLQAEILTTAAREVFHRVGADAVFPLDADEFLGVPSRAALERSIAAIPPGHTGRLAWLTFAPSFDPDEHDILSILRGARRLSVEAPVPDWVAGKSVLTPEFARQPDAYLITGSHHVVIGRHAASATPVPWIDLPREVARLGHLPVRNRAQYVAKTSVAHLALMASNRWFGENATRRRDYQMLRDGALPGPGTMLRRYIVGPADVGPVEPDVPETVEDRLIAPIVLRHSPRMPDDPLPPVLAAVEHMARRLAGARAPDASGAGPRQ